MKTWTFKALMMTASVLLLTACPKKGGGGGAVAVPPAVGFCTIGTAGCVAFTGSGSWKGTLTVAPTQYALFQQFMIENNLCGYYGCNQPVSIVALSIRVDGGSQGRLVLRTLLGNNWSRQRLNRNATVTTTNAAAGFNMLASDPYQIYGAQPQIYPQPAPVNSLQVSNVFASPVGNVLTTTLIYRGVPIASGTLQGQRTDYYGQQPGVPYPQPYQNTQQAPPVAPYYR